MNDRPVAEPSSFRLMSWNVRFDNPADGLDAWPQRKDWVAEIIRQQQVDVAGLQEVLPHQLDDLQQRLPDLDVYGVGREDGKRRGEFAPVWFRRERFELLDRDTFWLSPTPDQPGSRGWDATIPRIASWVKLADRRTGNVFYSLNTHFDHRGAEARAESAALLLQQVRETFADHPLVVTGDFNTTPDSLPYRTLVGGQPSNQTDLRDAQHASERKPEGPDSTWNGFDVVVPGQRIDFVFVTDSVRVLRHQILDGRRDDRFPSDHLPIVTTISLDDELAD